MHSLRQYNAPMYSDVATVFVANDEVASPPRNCFIHLGNAPRCLLLFLSSNDDPLSCPILFPCGESGWQTTCNISLIKNHITLIQFYCYLLAIRRGFNASAEPGAAICWIISRAILRQHQENQNNRDQDCPFGIIVISPSSYQGSPRNLTKC